MPGLLEIEDLTVAYSPGGRSAVQALSECSLTVGEAEAVGIFGKSGSGKTTLARTIPRLLPSGASIKGTVRLQGRNLLAQTGEEMRRLRGARIGFIPQEPSIALHPLLRVGRQVEEVLRAHGRTSAAAKEETEELFARSFGREAQRISRAFPFQLSGGERQRAVICQALCCKPALILADEPTSALDTVARKEFITLLRGLQDESGASLILFSHDRDLLRYAAGRRIELREGRLGA